MQSAQVEHASSIQSRSMNDAIAIKRELIFVTQLQTKHLIRNVYTKKYLKRFDCMHSGSQFNETDVVNSILEFDLFNVKSTSSKLRYSMSE